MSQLVCFTSQNFAFNLCNLYNLFNPWFWQNILNHGLEGLKDKHGLNTEQWNWTYFLHHWILHSICVFCVISIIRDSDKNILNHRLNRLKDQHGFITEQYNYLYFSASLNFEFNPCILCNLFNPWFWQKCWITDFKDLIPTRSNQ